MEIIIYILAAIGAFVVLGLFWALVAENSTLIFNEHQFTISVFGCGFSIIRTKEAQDSIEKMSGGRFRRFTINAPVWFNRTVYNFGVSAEPDGTTINPLWFKRFRKVES